MIPPPPPPLLNRRPSYGYGCVVQQPVASGPEPTHADQQPMYDPTAQPAIPPANVDVYGREVDGLIGTMNQPDLFNFASNTNGSLSGTLKSTLKSAKSSTNGKTTSGSLPMPADGKSKMNDPLPVMMVDLMNGNGTVAPPLPNGTDPTGTKPYPPYYFDDNYLHHHYYYRNGETGADVPLKDAGLDAAGQMYLYHQHHHHPDAVPAGYITNYDALNLPAKYNTIGANGDLPLAGHFSGLAGGGVGHHASSCNINQYSGSTKSNLIASHNHHFSNSISNFNFNPSQYFGSALDPPPGTTIIPGGGGDGFPSSCSLNGTPNKQQPHPWKHRQCPSRGSSSTGSGSSKWDLPSRQWLAVTSILLIAGAAGVAVPLALKVSSGAPLEERMQVATQLLDTVPLIDGHNDLPWNIRKFLHNQLNDFRFDDDLKTILPWSKSAWSHTDLQRLKRGRISAQFWAAYVPCEAQHKDAVQITLEQIDVIKRLTERYSPHLTSCASTFDIIQAHKNRQMCSLIGVEGGHSLGGSLGVLRIYYALGVRYMTLTSTCHTPWADSSNADAPKYDIRHGGLTAYGKTIVREMNRLGMIVDLSKSSVGTMKDVLATSQAPVIFSHSSAHALCNSSRNVQDEVLELVTKNRGLVMVNFYNKFLRCSDNASVQDAVAHINHIRRIAGVDHVGLGAGYDGINFTPHDLEDVSSYPRLFAELLGDGWTLEELEKLAGRNLLRVFEEVEKVRENQRLSGVRPYEEIPPVVRPEEHANCSTNS
uniref:Dipeptidase n=2 Tax=Anopheles arabiensis TaxID=7173 RepID=A0A2Y9D0S7_ANOAR